MRYKSKLCTAWIRNSYHRRCLRFAHSGSFARIAALVLGGWYVSLSAASAPAVDERHAFAVDRMTVREAIKDDNTSATLSMRCQCPLDGEYVVVVLYDSDLQGIDAQFPGIKRPFAGSVAVAMGVSISATVTDVNSGAESSPKNTLPTIFDAMTKKRRWSGERLVVFRLRGGSEYQIIIDIEKASPAWMSLNPVVILDPSEDLIKSLAWKTTGLRP